MEVGHKFTGDILIINLFGELFSEQAVFLDYKLMELITQSDKIIINCQDLEYVDSKGLGVLIKVLNHVNEQGGKMLFCSVTGKVKKLFDLTRLDRFIHVYTDLEQAIAQFKT